MHFTSADLVLSPELIDGFLAELVAESTVATAQSDPPLDTEIYFWAK